MNSNNDLYDMLYSDLNIKNEENIICDCKSGNSYGLNDGLQYCIKCGYMNNNNLDMDSELNDAYSSGSIINKNIEKASLGTNIVGTSYLSKINKWGLWMNNYKEKTFLEIIETIKKYCKDKIPNIIIDNAINVMKDINKAKHESGDNEGSYIIIRGLNKKSLIAASIYYASKKTNYPLTTIEVSSLFEINQKDLTRGEKLFDNLLPNSLKKNTIYISKNEITLYVSKYCNILKISKEYKKKSLDVANNLIRIEQNIVKGNSSLQALASIYLVIIHYNLKIDKKYIKNSIEIYSDTILNKIYKNILIYETLLCNNENTEEWINTNKKIREQLIIQNKYS